MIHGENVTLRAVEEQDLPTLTKWVNDPLLNKFVYSSFPIALSTQNNFYNELMKSKTRKVLIIYNNGNFPVGYFRVDNIDHLNQSVEIGATIGSSYQRNGYAFDAYRAMISYLFSEMNMNRIYLEVFSFNTPAIALYSKLGFKKEGTLRQAKFKNRKRRDVDMMSMLKEEWKESDGTTDKETP
jgi:RimJ/RimL family protein N-acetyltransferase